MRRAEYSRVDPHVHCRDWGEAYKARISDVVRLALSKGVCSVFDMPNTEPPILGRADAVRRLGTAREQGVLENYYLYVAATPREEQLEDAVRAYEEIPRVVGLKMYTSRMKGLEVESPEAQARVYRILAGLGYRGVLAVHCEDSSALREELWDPMRPYTWNDSRPPEAEISCVEIQLRASRSEGFNGVLYFVHVSTPEAVERILRARKEGARVAVGVAPHHMIFSTDHMRSPEGVFLKVNPPIRDPRRSAALLRLAAEGAVDFLETDHAPHAAWEKAGPPHLSGMRSLEIYDKAVEELERAGASERVIYMLTRGNVESIFEKFEGS